MGVIVEQYTDYSHRNSYCIVFKEPQEWKHNDGEASFKRLFPGTPYVNFSSMWVPEEEITLAQELTPAEIQKEKEENIINKCKFLDKRFLDFKKWKKTSKQPNLTYKEYCYPQEKSNDD